MSPLPLDARLMRHFARFVAHSKKIHWVLTTANDTTACPIRQILLSQNKRFSPARKCISGKKVVFFAASQTFDLRKKM